MTKTMVDTKEFNEPVALTPIEVKGIHKILLAEELFEKLKDRNELLEKEILFWAGESIGYIRHLPANGNQLADHIEGSLRQIVKDLLMSYWSIEPNKHYNQSEDPYKPYDAELSKLIIEHWKDLTKKIRGGMKSTGFNMLIP